MDTNTWGFIGEKMKKIQSGLLRFQDKSGKKSFEVRSVQPDHPSLVSLLMAENEDPARLINHEVSLTQKSSSGYIYVSGLVSGVGQNDTLHMTVLKAFWFVKRGKGKSTWLEENCVYEKLKTS